MFKDKIIVITGGSDGIGKALTEAFLRQGATVATCGRNQQKLDALAKEIKEGSLFTMMADVSSEEDCKKFIQSVIARFGDVDVLINNAGISMRALLKILISLP